MNRKYSILTNFNLESKSTLIKTCIIVLTASTQQRYNNWRHAQPHRMATQVTGFVLWAHTAEVYFIIYWGWSCAVCWITDWLWDMHNKSNYRGEGPASLWHSTSNQSSLQLCMCQRRKNTHPFVLRGCNYFLILAYVETIILVMGKCHIILFFTFLFVSLSNSTDGPIIHVQIV